MCRRDIYEIADELRIENRELTEQVENLQKEIEELKATRLSSSGTRREYVIQFYEYSCHGYSETYYTDIFGETPAGDVGDAFRFKDENEAWEIVAGRGSGWIVIPVEVSEVVKKIED